MFRLLFICVFVGLVSSQRLTNTKFYNHRTTDRRYDSVGQVKSRQTFDTSYLLPTSTVPIRYAVHIKTDIDRMIFDFSGNVRILINIVEDTTQITLHQRQLQIQSVQLSNANGESVDLIGFTYDAQREFLAVHTNGVVLSQGSLYTLEISYTGVLRGELAGDIDAGFYRSVYTDLEGNQRWLAATQFQATDGRHGFPMYDEPAIKAVFSISITHISSYSAISNMPVAYETVEGDYTTTTFEDTPNMSTYLIAYVVSDFVYKSVQIDSVLHRAFGIAHRIDEVDFAFEAGQLILPHLEEYVNKTYDLPKLDQIAIPNFAAGAMENWGLVTYLEAFFLYDEERTALRSLLDIALTVSHEYVHQFFGNLVSPQWWSYLWMNEGFATLYEFYLIDDIYPDFRVREMFPISIVQYSFLYDMENTRPMTYYVYTHDEIEYLFDNIAYDKSSCVLRMILHALTEPVFVDGLHDYLVAHSYQATIPDDLSESLTKAAAAADVLPSGATMKDIMDTWTLQEGYPILTVTKNYATNTVQLFQERMFEYTTYDPYQTTWWLPYNYVTKSEVAEGDIPLESLPIYWIPNIPRVEIELSGSPNDWVLFNKNQFGYYRVNYDIENWNALAAELDETVDLKINSINRAQLIDDAFNLARSKRLEYATAFNIISYLDKEVDYFPWTTFNENFRFIERALHNTTSHDITIQYLYEKSEGLYNRVLTADLSANYVDKIFAAFIYNLACRAGHQDCLSTTNAMLLNHLNNADLIPNHLIEVTLINGIRLIDQVNYIELFRRLHTQNDLPNRSVQIRAFGYPHDEAILQQIIDSLLTANGDSVNGVIINYRTTDRILIALNLLRSGLTAYELLYENMMSQRDLFVIRLGGYMYYIFEEMIQKTRTYSSLESYRNLLSLYENPQNELRFAYYIAEAAYYVQWTNENIDDITTQLLLQLDN